MKSKCELKILVIEDDPIAIFLTSSKLKKYGLTNFRVATNGKDALDVLKEQLPELIFLDLNMPVMDGFEFLQVLEKKGIGEQIPIIVLTSSVRPSDRKIVMQNRRVRDFLEKPLSAQDLDKVWNTITLPKDPFLSAWENFPFT